jgi:hypothetical protein
LAFFQFDLKVTNIFFLLFFYRRLTKESVRIFSIVKELFAEYKVVFVGQKRKGKKKKKKKVVLQVAASYDGSKSWFYFNFFFFQTV